MTALPQVLLYRGLSPVSIRYCWKWKLYNLRTWSRLRERVNSSRYSSSLVLVSLIWMHS